VLGADSLELAISHRAEIGYWLAQPYWGRGIMTDAVKVYVSYAFKELSVARLTAHVFAFNRSSARVLEKNEFKLEGRLRKHFSKNGELIDGLLYGLLKEEVI
jgi:RimJ/RimL family protein N-acetyltransferase